MKPNAAFRKLAVSAGLLLLSHALYAQVGGLRCEHLESPVGLDEPAPRLGWKQEGERQLQTHYRIVVGDDREEVARGRGDLWDSGEVASGDQLVVYAGRPLQPFTRYYWAVEVKTAEGSRYTSAPDYFEMGLMESRNWQGTWISDTYDPAVKPAAWFRKAFTAGKTIASAWAYIAVGGLYELYVNGERIGDHRLDPMFTRFDRRTLYLTHDVTEQIQQGENAIGVWLGNGWYNHQSTAVWYFHLAPWRARPKFCLDLRITYTDGSVETVSTDDTWKTAESAVIFNSIYTAEHYDARREQPGWNRTGFDDGKWKNAFHTGSPSQNITAQQIRPIRDVEKILPIRMERNSARDYLFDLGRNIAGVSEIRVTGEAGTTLRLVHGERLDPDGNVDLSNIDYHYRPTDDSDPFQTDIFILKGDPAGESFRARFNYKGFQYVQVYSDRPVELDKTSLHGWFMHSDVPAAGSIRSSNPLLDKIWTATNNAYLSNLFGYPTDCPQREKNGWTGDGHIAIETALYNFDAVTVYEKWLADHRDEQQANGLIPAIIPTSGWGYHWGNGVDWTSTIAIIPWNIYLFYGDSRLLERCYDNIKRYVDHITDRYPDGLTDWGLGDWIPIQSVAVKELTSSIYYCVDADILAKAARLFGRTEDAEKYSALADQIRTAVNDKYLDPATGIYANGLQTEQSFPLLWGIVPDSLRPRVARQLAERVKADGALDVGLHGSKSILNALSENGYAEIAYDLAVRDTYPSWGWWIRNGATTLYENWKIEGNRDLSMNHIMFGEIGAWFYKALGGIFPDPEKPGFAHVLLKPNFVAGLEHFEARHTSPYGEIVSGWERKGGRIHYRVTVPPNSSATVEVEARSLRKQSGDPVKSITDNDGKVRAELGPGSYSFELSI